MFDDIRKLTTDGYAAQLYVQKATMLHMTCLGPQAGMKTWVAKILGAWSDTDGYYSSFPSKLRIVTVPSLKVNRVQASHVLSEIGCIVSIMQSFPDNFLFMPPSTVEVVGENSSDTFPFHWVYNVADLGLQLNLVEPFYLQHWHKQQAQISLDTQPSLATPAPLQLEAGSSVESLVSWIEESEGYVELINLSELSCKSEHKDSVKVCANLDADQRGCLSQCTS